MKLTNYQKNWIIAGVSFLICAGISMALGFGISSITKTPVKAREAEQNESVSDDVTTPEPSGTEQIDDAVGTVVIKDLSADERDAIQAAKDGNIKDYYLSENKDSGNRPLSASHFAETMKATYGKKVRVFMSEPKSIGLSFVLREENGENTIYILDQLKEKNVQATFIVDLDYTMNNPTVIERILNDGHTLATMGSAIYADGFPSLSLEEQNVNAMDIQRYLRMNYDYEIQDFYFYNDKYSEQSIELLTRMGYNVDFYTVCYPDYDPSAEIDANAFLGAMESAVHEGAIYTFHTVNSASLLVVPALITSLRDQGYTVGPIQ